MASVEIRKSVPAVERAFSILELLAASKRGLSSAELVEKTGLPRSSVHCLTLTLERGGYLHRSAATGRYLLGLKLFGLANYANGGLELRERAAPELVSLMQQTRLTVHLAVLENDEPVLVSKIDSPGIIRLATWAGKRMEFHGTAVGKAMAAFLPEATVLRILAARGLTRHNENTILCERSLLDELRSVRAKGYALDDEEEEIGLRCIGAPVFDASGTVVGAVSIAGLSSLIHAENVAANAAKVKSAAARVSAMIGFRPKAAAAPVAS